MNVIKFTIVKTDDVTHILEKLNEAWVLSPIGWNEDSDDTLPAFYEDNGSIQTQVEQFLGENTNAVVYVTG
jgi:hypothetical protein